MEATPGSQAKHKNDHHRVLFLPTISVFMVVA